MLDIIMPHYKEPWSEVQKFFKMLDLQREIDFNAMHVILVHDGDEYRFPDRYFEKRPYKVTQMSIPHGGVSAARNAGLEASDADWVMFCDCDDMFANVFALADVLPFLTDQYDVLWTDFIAEDLEKNGQWHRHLRNGENVVFVHGKFYRRVVLMEHHLRFDTGVTFNEDSEFNAIALTEIDTKRAGKINTPSPMYVWCYREGSLTTTPENHWEIKIGTYWRNRRVCDAYRKNCPYERFAGMVTRTVYDAYYSLNLNPFPGELESIRKDFISWWKEHKKFFRDVPEETLVRITEVSEKEHDAGIREADAHWEENAIHDSWDGSCSIDDWLKTLESE